MRICSYNIHGGVDADRQPSLAVIIATLQTVDADVVLLQEVDRYLPRSGRRDQAKEIAHALDMKFHFYGRLRFLWTAFGNAILTRGRAAAKVERLRLPASGGEPRGAIGVTLADGIVVWNTHLGLNEKWRATQLAALARAVNQVEGPVLVGGDFNAFVDSPEVAAFLNETGVKFLSPDAPTFPAANPTARIDFLLGRGVEVEKAGVVADAGSDHCLIWADVHEPPSR